MKKSMAKSSLLNPAAGPTVTFGSMPTNTKTINDKSVDLSDVIEVKHVENNDKNGNPFNPKFETLDKIFIPHTLVMSSGYGEDFILCSPTDFAVANKCELDKYNKNTTKKGKHTTQTWLRDFKCLNYSGNVNLVAFSLTATWGIRPQMNLDIKKFLKAKSNYKNFGKIEEVKDKNGKILYHTLEFGEYPQSRVDDKLNDILEDLLKQNKIIKTEKKYSLSLDATSKTNAARYVSGHKYEYEYNGNKYVRLNPKFDYDTTSYADGTTIDKSKEYQWFKVESIKWIILNWAALPTSINPNGTTKLSLAACGRIELLAEEALIANISFYPNPIDKYCNMWQNSSIRGFLNGINVNNIKTNGNKRYSAKNGGNWEGEGFIDQAFKNVDLSDKQVEARQEVKVETKKPSNSKRKTRLEKLNPYFEQSEKARNMTDTELIKTWIDNGESVLLRGPSGIGKTDRIKKLYPDLIYIKLTNNMFPEKVVGSMNLQTGQAIPPDFVKTALLSEANEEEKKLINENIQNIYELADKIYERSKNSDKKVVILLDELLNVKPAVQSLVYTLVLNKLVETGKGLKLPANTVIVATGNQKKYSSVAQDLAEPLEKRFDHILDMEPKVVEWLEEYAIPNKVHPMVIGYIFMNLFHNTTRLNSRNITYFYEEPEIGEKNKDNFGSNGRTNDPRGWVSVSNMLYAFEEDLKNNKFVGKDVEEFLKISLKSKLRDTWADKFLEFYTKEVYSVEDIINKNYTQEIFNGYSLNVFAQIVNLLTANKEQIETVREFIKKLCDPMFNEFHDVETETNKILDIFDLMWAGDDVEKIEKIAELKEQDKLKQEQKYKNMNEDELIEEAKKEVEAKNKRLEKYMKEIFGYTDDEINQSIQKYQDDDDEGKRKFADKIIEQDQDEECDLPF